MQTIPLRAKGDFCAAMAENLHKAAYSPACTGRVLVVNQESGAVVYDCPAGFMTKEQIRNSLAVLCRHWPFGEYAAILP